MDQRYNLILDYIERASAVLASIPDGSIELANILRHTAKIMRLRIDAEEESGKILDFDKYRGTLP